MKTNRRSFLGLFAVLPFALSASPAKTGISQVYCVEMECATRSGKRATHFEWEGSRTGLEKLQKYLPGSRFKKVEVGGLKVNRLEWTHDKGVVMGPIFKVGQTVEL